jgi:hypothetical protein
MRRVGNSCSEDCSNFASDLILPYPKVVEGHFTPEQEAQLSQIAIEEGTDPSV